MKKSTKFILGGVALIVLNFMTAILGGLPTIAGVCLIGYGAAQRLQCR